MEENKEIIGDGKFVAFAYTVKDADNGEILFEAKPSAPDVMIYGVSQEVIPGLLATIKGLAKGDRFSVTLPPEVAFGNRNEEYVQQVPVEAFMRDGKMAVELKEGSMLDMMTNTGDIVTGMIKKITPEFVEMDFNHPFAGKTVEYKGEVVEVLDATPEALQPDGSGCCGGG
ncbi:MAG: FKBP-type peptidyl-prolyl cis-trans isomerase, partial [Muribaculaceae bacterium]|nr:FKBP-type peptidyl-prolyl cis-trans isomerase [Muribaculaceae bacterium]